MGCKNCSDVTVLTGEAGNGIQTVVDNGDGTFTFFFTDGSTFTTPDFNGSGGTPGAAATITVGAVTIGPPGTAPSVTNVGTPEAAIFNFVFPIGIGYDKTLWVDDQFGNDTTGLSGRIDLPYKTIAAALADANQYDTVHVRTGSYTEDIVLIHLVNIYLDEGVIINGEIFDNDPLTSLTNAVTANISGNGVLQDNQTSSACINILGDGSDIKIRLRKIINQGTGILQKPPGKPASNTLLVEVDIFEGNITNYFITARGKSDCTIIVNQYAETTDTGLAAFAGVDVRNGFSGTMNFRCPKIIIGTGNNAAGGRAFSSEIDTELSALVNFEVDTIINNYDFSGTPSLAFGTLNANGNGTYIFKVGNCYSKVRSGLVVGAEDINASPHVSKATVIFEGMIFTRDTIAARFYAADDSATELKIIIKNSSITRGVNSNASSLTPDRNSVIIVGNAGFGTSQWPISGGTSDYINLEFINTQIIKSLENGSVSSIATGQDPSTNNGAVCIQGENNRIYFKGCDIVSGIANQTLTSSFCVTAFLDTATLLAAPNEIDVYFKDTQSNKPLKTSSPGKINELNTDATGFIEDANLTTFNYLYK